MLWGKSPSIRLTFFAGYGMRRFVVGLVVLVAIVGTAYFYRHQILSIMSGLNPVIGVTSAQSKLFAPIVKRVAPAVVTIFTTSKDPKKNAIGSGFVIDADGFIVTNDHVIDNATKIVVQFENGKNAEATLVGTDKPTDVALLKVTVTWPVTFVMFGDDRDSEVGDWVLAMGSPDAKPGTVTAGILSARGRDGVEGGSMFTDYLQIDAAINHGNSGGPTFNMLGEVIGVNTLASYNSIDPRTGVGERNEGLGFAIPSSTVSVVVQGLRSGRFNRGLLGVFLDPLTETDAIALGLSDTKGALVTKIVEGSPAEKAGVKINDVILKIDDNVVENNLDCLRKISLLQPGQTAAFTIWRDKAELALSVTVVSRDTLAQVQTAPDPSASTVAEFTSLGVTLRSGPLQSYIDGSAETGVFVEHIGEQTDLSALRIRRGYRIIAVGSQAVHSLADVTAAIDAAKAQQLGAVLLYVETPMGGKAHTSIRIK